MGLVAAAVLLAFGVWVWMQMRKHSDQSLSKVGHSAAHDVAMAVSHVPKGIYLFPVVGLLIAGLGLTGRLGLRALRVPISGAIEGLFSSIMIGIALFLPWTLVWGTYLGLTTFEVVLMLAAFYIPGGIYSVWRREPQRCFQSFNHWRANFRPVVSRKSVITAALSIILAVSLYQILLGTLVPEVAYDARWYHLGVPAHYVARGYFYNSVGDNSIAISGGPFYQEILYTPFFSLFGQIGAKMVNFIDLLLLGTVTFALARRITGSRNLALCSVIIVAAQPIVSWEATSAQNDIGVSVPVAVAFYCFLRWTDDTALNGWLFAGFASAGVAAGTKVYGVSIVLFLCLGAAIVYVGEFRRTRAARGDVRRFVRGALVTGLGALSVLVAVGAPGLIRAAAMTGDPVFPALYHIFNSPYWNEGNSAAMPVAPGHYFPRVFGDVFTIAWDELTAQGRPNWPHTAQWGPIYVLFTPVVVIAALWRRNRSGDLGYLWIAILITLAFWYPLINPLGTRYLLPAAPLFSVGVVAVLGNLARARSTRVVASCSVVLLSVTVLVGQPFVNQLLPGVDNPGETQGGTYYVSDYLYGSSTIYDVQEAYLPLVQYVNKQIPESARIWDARTPAGLLPVYLYVKPEVFSGWFYDGPRASRQWDICSQDAAYWLAKRGVGYVAVPTFLAKQFAASALSRDSTKLYAGSGISLYRVDSAPEHDTPFAGERKFCSAS